MSIDNTYQLLIVPGEPLYDLYGYATGAVSKECTELTIHGIANYDRVATEISQLRREKGYSLFMEENISVPIIDTNGAVKKGDYLVRSKKYPTFFERALIQDFSTRPVGIAVEDRSFEPDLVPVMAPKKISVKKEMQELVTEPRVLRRYKLVKTFDDATNDWIANIEEHEEIIQETVYQDVTIRGSGTDGALIVVGREPVMRTYEIDVEQEEGEEVVGEQLEYPVQYLHKNGSFASEPVNGGFRTCHIKMNLFNYMI